MMELTDYNYLVAMNLYTKDIYELEDLSIQEFMTIESEEIKVINNDLKNKLSKEAKEVIDLCLNTPSEFLSLIYTPTKTISKKAKNNLSNHFKKKWKKPVEPIIEEVMDYIAGDEEKIEQRIKQRRLAQFKKNIERRQKRWK